MIGNDVIDLQLAAVQSNWQRPGFREKVFTEKENRLIDGAEDPFMTVWRLWSMKESAYKAYQRTHPRRFLNPKKMECSIADHSSGQVQVAGQIFQTQSNVTKDWVYTIVEQGKSKQCSTRFFLIPISVDESTFCHQALIRQYAARWSLSSCELRIEKTNQGVPRLTCESTDRSMAISITHHGRFGAFIIQD